MDGTVRGDRGTVSTRRPTERLFTVPSAGRGYSTLVVEQVDEAAWRVTQHGVDVVGVGESAPLAAADYCRRVAEVADGDD